MAKIKTDIKGLEKLAERLKKLSKDQIREFGDEAVKELAGRLLGKAVEKTPVGRYGKEVTTAVTRGKNKGQLRRKWVNKTGKVGGTLRRGWTVGTIERDGDLTRIDVINPVEYASYVEYGHRTRNHRGWVPGRFMLRRAEAELEREAPVILEKMVTAMIGEALDG